MFPKIIVHNRASVMLGCVQVGSVVWKVTRDIVPMCISWPV